MGGITLSDTQSLDGDPRHALAHWANKNDEWIRRIVRQVLGSNSQLSDSERTLVYQLLLEEKGINERTLQAEPPLGSPAQPLVKPEPFHLVRISNVKGVNALVEDQHIDFGPGLTLLYGENGMGKTGYARILKRLAGSRSAEEILSDVNLEDAPPPSSADIDYQVGGTDLSCHWNGGQAQPPFTQMSIFDNPSARLHVDDDLRYTYRPASLDFFDRVNHEVQKIGEFIEKERESLKFNNSTLLGRFDSQSAIYPYIEALGPDTNLEELQQYLTLPDNAAGQERELESTIAALRADMVGQQVSIKSRFQNILNEALEYTAIVRDFKIQDYGAALTKVSELHGDQRSLRDSLFAAANLPADPEQTWEDFIRSGREYRRHLEGLGVHDDTLCLYCRQPLGTEAIDLIVKYSEYLESQIAKDIETQESTIQNLVKPVEDSSLRSVQSFCELVDADTDKGIPAPAEQMEALRNLVALDGTLRKQLTDKVMVDESVLSKIYEMRVEIGLWLSDIKATLEVLRAQDSNREKSLAEEENKLLDLKARLELKRSWEEVKGIVDVARRDQKLKTERAAISNILRNITLLSNRASEQLINNNFEQIFRNECTKLRAPRVELEFSGREGRAQRKKRLPGGINPSRILSEGEQKVLAIADFLAEAKMSDSPVPVIFDDPVSSLDHRRVGEMARRIADLASDHQVVVFAHDIWLVTHLLGIFEESDRCKYYQVTDDHGKGTVTHGTGPRWDTIGSFRAKINLSIEAARRADGEERQSHIRDAYSSIRSWCELFVEQDVLAKVTERYQPNVRMTSLSRIKVQKLEQTIQTVTFVFEDACRFIDAHSQPLSTLSVAPTLSDLESNWSKLEKCRREYNRD